MRLTVWRTTLLLSVIAGSAFADKDRYVPNVDTCTGRSCDFNDADIVSEHERAKYATNSNTDPVGDNTEISKEELDSVSSEDVETTQYGKGVDGVDETDVEDAIDESDKGGEVEFQLELVEGGGYRIVSSKVSAGGQTFYNDLRSKEDTVEKEELDLEGKGDRNVLTKQVDKSGDNNDLDKTENSGPVDSVIGKDEHIKAKSNYGDTSETKKSTHSSDAETHKVAELAGNVDLSETVLDKLDESKYTEAADDLKTVDSANNVKTSAFESDDGFKSVDSIEFGGLDATDFDQRQYVNMVTDTPEFDMTNYEFPVLSRVQPGNIGDVEEVELEEGVMYKRITRALQPPVFGKVLIICFVLLSLLGILLTLHGNGYEVP